MYDFVGKLVVGALAAYGAVKAMQYVDKRGSKGVKEDAARWYLNLKHWLRETDKKFNE